MNKIKAKELAYSDHEITFRVLKEMIEATDTSGISKINKSLPKLKTLEIFNNWLNEIEKENKLDKIVNSTRLKRNSCKNFTLTGDGLAMVNILVECN